MLTGKQRTIIPVGMAPSPPNPVAQLRAEAKRRHLKWMIFCVPGDPNDPGDSYRYQAEAWVTGTEAGDEVEDGGKDWWGFLASTPQQAAAVLYLAIQSPGNMAALHRAKPSKQRGCNYQTVLDSEHLSNIPCKVTQ